MNTLCHGHAKRKQHTATYKAWAGMKKRCCTPSMYAYKYYGGRGISVCDRWLEYSNFLIDMGEKPDNCSLDRIDNNGNYEPSNCRWATKEEQMNNRTNSVRYECFGKRLTIPEWAKEVGLPYNTVYLRIKRGTEITAALTRPYYSRKHQSK